MKKVRALLLAAMILLALFALMACNEECTHQNCTITNAGNGQHTVACNDCDYEMTENCSGGTATCQKGKLCEKCDAEYTEKDPNAHTWNAETGKCNVEGCDKACTHNYVVSDNNVNDALHTMTCSICSYVTTDDCKGGTATCQKGKLCEKCGAEYTAKDPSAHTWNAATGECDVEGCEKVCGHNYVASDNNLDDALHTMTCSICNHVTTDDCKGGTATCQKGKLCEKCGAEYTAKDPDAHDWNAETGECDVYGCDEICSHNYVVSDNNLDDALHTMTCSICNHVTTDDCRGGTATCQKGKLCEKCGAEYTAKDPDAHDWNAETGECDVEGCLVICEHIGHTTATSIGNAQHKITCSVCGHEATRSCSGGTVTCQKGKICDNCNTEYTAKDPSAHTWNAATGECDVEGCEEVCSHNYTVSDNNIDDGLHAKICSICGYATTESCTGGTVTCQKGKLCEKCGDEYTAKDPSAHTWNAATGECDVYGCDAICSHNYVASNNQIDDDLHTITCNICNHVTTEDCKGGEANTVERANCTECGAAYGELYRYKYVVVIGVDGAGAFFKDTSTPNLDRIFENGAVSYTATTANPAISAESWASLMHGVTPEVHHVTNESVKAPFATDSPYPSFFRVISENCPDAKLASFCDWTYVNSGIIEEGLRNMTKNGGGSGADQVAFVKAYLETDIPTALFVHIDDADLAGHGHGFGSPGQLNVITTIDGYIGQIYDAYVNKGLIDDTLFIVTADHGGVDTAHGMWAESCRNIIYAVAGKTVKQGGTIQDAEIRDTASIVLHALGLADKQPETWTSRVPGDLFKGVDATDRPVYIDKTTERYHETEPTPEADSNKHVTNFVDNDLAVYLPFDGDVTDQRGNTTTTPNGNLQYTDGYFGNAIMLGDGYVTLNDYALKNESFTISMWFQTKGSDAIPCIISNADWGGDKKGFTLAMYDNRDFRINIGTGSENFYCDMALPCGYAPYLPFGASPDFKEGWTHMSLSVDHEKNEIRFCFDFKWVFVLPYENLDDLDLGGVLNGLNIGQDGTGAYEDKLDIMMDELMIFNGAFDAEDHVNLAKYYGKELGGSDSTGTITLDGVQNTDITDDASAVAAGAVVRLNGNAYYTTLQAAINAANAANGGTVTLLANVTVDSTITVSKIVVIDGKGQYTITYTGEGTLLALSGNDAAVAFEGIDLSANAISGVEASIYTYDHTLYSTFIGAVAATKNDAYNDKITLLANVTLNDPLTISNKVSIIGNTYTLTASAAITLSEAGSLELNGVSVPTDKLVGAVASIENNGVVAYYAALQTAFTASGGYKVGVIKLLCDITLPANTTLEIARATANITIDGKKPDGSGNYKITATAGADNYKIFSSTYASTVITLQNLDITMNSTPIQSQIFDGRATINVLNCNVRSDKRGFNLVEGKLTVSNTFLYAVDEFAISLFRSNADLEIKDNSKIFSVKATAVHADCNNGKITVADSVIAGGNETIYITGHKKCDIVLNDGTILDNTWPSRNGYPEIVAKSGTRAILMMNCTGTYTITLSGNVYISNVAAGSDSPEIYAHKGTLTWNVTFGTDTAPFEGTQIIRKTGTTYYFYDDVATAYGAMITGDTVFTYSEATANEIMARGYIVEKNGQIYTVVGTPVTEYVAQIGDNKYETLEAAFAAATNGCTIKLLADITLPTQTTFTISDAITLDGKKAAGSGNYTITATASAASYKIFYSANASTVFTLQNLDITLNSTPNTTQIFDGKATLNLLNCNLRSDKRGIQITDGKLTISNTVLYARDDFAIQTGYGTNTDIEIKDNSKVLSVKSNAINIKQKGTLTITDSVLSAGNETIYINTSANCDVTLNDGAIVDNTWAAKNGYPEIVAKSGSRAILIMNCSGTYTITLNGNVYINNVYTAGSDTPEIRIHGGTPTVNVTFGTSFTGAQIIRKNVNTYQFYDYYFYDDVATAYYDAVDGDTVFTYSEVTANAIKAKNYIVEKDGQAYIVVDKDVTNCVAQIGDKKYDTLEEALAVATDDCTITLIKDVTVTDQLTITKNITINGNKNGDSNYKITVDVATSNFRLFNVEADFTLQNVDVAFINSSTWGSIIYSTGKAVTITINDSYLDSTNTVFRLHGHTDETKPTVTISGSTLIASASVIYFENTAASEVTIQNQSRLLGRGGGGSAPAESVFYFQHSVTTISITNSVISGVGHMFQIRYSDTDATIYLGEGAIVDKSWEGLDDNITPRVDQTILFQGGGQGMITLDGDAYIRGYGSNVATIGNKANFTFSEDYAGTQIIRLSGSTYYFYDYSSDLELQAGDFTYSEATANKIKALGYIVEKDGQAYTVVGKTVTEYVAQIGENKYGTLEEAFAAATNGCTIKLLSDIKLPEQTTFTISEAITLTIDGQWVNGTDTGNYKITATANANNYVVFDSTNASAVITLQNLDITLISTPVQTQIFNGKANLNVLNCNLISDKRGIQITDGKLTISNTLLLAKDEFAIQNSYGTNVDIEIKDNSKIFSAKSNVINFYRNGKITITKSVLAGGNETIHITGNYKCDIVLNDGAILDNTWPSKNGYTAANGYADVTANTGARSILVQNATGTYTITLNGNAYLYCSDSQPEIWFYNGSPTFSVNFGTPANGEDAEIPYTGTQIIRKSGSTYDFYTDVATALNAAAASDTVFTYSEATANAATTAGYTVTKDEENGYYKISKATA